MSEHVVRIGGASAYYGDTQIAVPQLLRAPKLDYLVFDYLSEGAMGMFGRLAAADPSGGYPPNFLDVHVGPHLREILDRGIKVVANAGGVNPAGLARAIEAFAREMGCNPRVIAVEGDNLMDKLDELRGLTDMFGGKPFPDNVISANVYLGALPIAEALGRGADIVVTGRIVDSATTLGVLIHEFGWKADDYEMMSAGTLAGHLLECGAQITGGTFTDWEDVPDWANIGFPIGECAADGSLVITKAPNTGGIVSIGTVAEQMLYEVSDPQAYFVPDVTCDFSEVRIEQVGSDRVRVSGARGYPPTATYKLCVTWADGWRVATLTPIIGHDAAAKAERTARSLMERIEGLLRQTNYGPFKRQFSNIAGQEASLGAQGRARDSREVMLKMVVDHDDRRAIDLYAREHHSASSSMSPGTSINQATNVFPLTRLNSFLIDKTITEPRLVDRGETTSSPVPTDGGFAPGMIERPGGTDAEGEADVTVELIELAWARSGDKGDLFNVAVIARRPEYLPWIRRALTERTVADWYAHVFEEGAPRHVTRYDLPGTSALNFLVHDGLTGGINASPRIDPVAKTMGQQLLFFPVPVPIAVAEAAGAERRARSARVRADANDGGGAVTAALEHAG